MRNEQALSLIFCVAGTCNNNNNSNIISTSVAEFSKDRVYHIEDIVEEHITFCQNPSPSFSSGQFH